MKKLILLMPAIALSLLMLAGCTEGRVVATTQDHGLTSFSADKTYAVKSIRWSQADYDYAITYEYNDAGYKTSRKYSSVPSSGGPTETHVINWRYNAQNSLVDRNAYTDDGGVREDANDLVVKTVSEERDGKLVVTETIDSAAIDSQKPESLIPQSQEWTYGPDDTLVSRDIVSKGYINGDAAETKDYFGYDDEGYLSQARRQPQVNNVSTLLFDITVTHTDTAFHAEGPMSLGEGQEYETVVYDFGLTYENGYLIQAASDQTATYEFSYVEIPQPTSVTKANLRQGAFNELLGLAMGFEDTPLGGGQRLGPDVSTD